MNKKGYTLVEVLTSIVIVGIVFLAMTSMLISSAKINKKLLIKENVVSEIGNINNLFSSDPVNFEENLNQVYKCEQTDNEFKIYYNDRYTVSENITENYIIVEYIKTTSMCSIIIDVYHENNKSIDYSNITRNIKISEKSA